MFPNFERPFLLFSFLIFRRLEPMDSLILHVEFTFLRPIFRSLGSKILYPTYLTRRGQLSCHPSQRFFELVYRHFTASVHTVHTFIEYIPIWGFQWTNRITKLKYCNRNYLSLKVNYYQLKNSFRMRWFF